MMTADLETERMKVRRDVAEQDPWPNWASWSTLVEVEFFHNMLGPEAPDGLSPLGPCPDNLYAGLNTGVKAVTTNGIVSGFQMARSFIATGCRNSSSSPGVMAPRI